jgi:DNA-binding transcriptional regulator YiaG
VVASAFGQWKEPQSQDQHNIVSFKAVAMQPQELVAIREEMDLTQEDFAAMISVSQPTLSQMENGIIRIRKKRADKARKLLQEYHQQEAKKAS